MNFLIFGIGDRSSAYPLGLLMGQKVIRVVAE